MPNSTVQLRLKLYQIVSIIRAEKVGILHCLARDHSTLGYSVHTLYPTAFHKGPSFKLLLPNTGKVSQARLS